MWTIKTSIKKHLSNLKKKLFLFDTKLYNNFFLHLLFFLNQRLKSFSFSFPSHFPSRHLPNFFWHHLWPVWVRFPVRFQLFTFLLLFLSGTHLNLLFFCFKNPTISTSFLDHFLVEKWREGRERERERIVYLRESLFDIVCFLSS